MSTHNIAEQFELLQKKYNHLFELSSKLRRFQLDIVKFKVGKSVQLAKRYEHELDEFIKKELEKVKEANQLFQPFKADLQ